MLDFIQYHKYINNNNLPEFKQIIVVIKYQISFPLLDGIELLL